MILQIFCFSCWIILFGNPWKVSMYWDPEMVKLSGGQSIRGNFPMASKMIVIPISQLFLSEVYKVGTFLISRDDDELTRCEISYPFISHCGNFSPLKNMPPRKNHSKKSIKYAGNLDNAAGLH